MLDVCVLRFMQRSGFLGNTDSNTRMNTLFLCSDQKAKCGIDFFFFERMYRVAVVLKISVY
jgi:hypothetical protein